MHGPEILARFLSAPGPATSGGHRWQYHSRSDRHSKVGSWGVAFDLLFTSALMQQHAFNGKIVLGVNHEMRDFTTSRKKDLDLVIARPGTGVTTNQGQSLRGLVNQYGIQLTPTEEATLRLLPDIPVANVGAVLVAMEAKAAMTAHVKALPRLYDELNSSHLCVHGASSQALAIGYVQVNAADTFVSPNPRNVALMDLGQQPLVTIHNQPADTIRVLDKVNELPRRGNSAGVGFDAIGVSVIELHNDGRPVSILDPSPAPQPGDAFHYDSMIIRMAHQYDITFSHV